MKPRLTLTLVVFLAASVLIDLLFVTHGEGNDQFWTAIPAFAFMFGVIGCIVIIVGSKSLGGRFLQKDEGYYGDEHSE